MTILGWLAAATLVVQAAPASSFEIPNVLPGSYDLLAGMNFNSETPSIARTVIDVRNQDVSGVVLTIRPGVLVKGNIMLDGKGISDRALVRIEPADTLKRLNAQLSANMDANGAFTIAAVPDGRFRLSVAVLNPDLYVDDIQQGGVSIYDKGFEIRGGAPDPIEVSVKAGTASLTGTLQDPSGKLLGGGAVALVPATRRDNPSLYRVSSADATGGFTIREIPPGDYKIFSWDYMPEGAAYNAAFLEKYEERGIPITLAAGAKLTSKVTLIQR